jgi:hypothetical protein
MKISFKYTTDRLNFNLNKTFIYITLRVSLFMKLLIFKQVFLLGLNFESLLPWRALTVRVRNHSPSVVIKPVLLLLPESEHC